VSTAVPRCTAQLSNLSWLPFKLCSDSQDDRMVEPSRPDSMSQRRERQEHDVLVLAELRKGSAGAVRDVPAPGLLRHDPSSIEGSMADVDSPSLSRVPSKAGWKRSGRGFVFRNFVVTKPSTGISLFP
jgi:hypothetical protein